MSFVALLYLGVNLTSVIAGVNLTSVIAKTADRWVVEFGWRVFLLESVVKLVSSVRTG